MCALEPLMCVMWSITYIPGLLSWEGRAPAYQVSLCLPWFMSLGSCHCWCEQSLGGLDWDGRHVTSLAAWHRQPLESAWINHTPSSSSRHSLPSDTSPLRSISLFLSGWSFPHFTTLYVVQILLRRYSLAESLCICLQGFYLGDAKQVPLQVM